MVPRLQSIRPSLGCVLILLHCSTVITQSCRRPACVIHMQMLLNPPLFFRLFVFNPTTARFSFFFVPPSSSNTFRSFCHFGHCRQKQKQKTGRLNMDGTEMLIGCAVRACALANCVHVHEREPRHFVFPRCSTSFPCAHPFFLPSFLIRRRLFLKERLTDAPSAGAPFHHTPNPLLVASSFIRPPSPTLLPTISQESWRHYAMRWKSVTSLSRWRRAQCLPTSVLQQLRLTPSPSCPFRQERERERLWLPFSARQPISHTVAGWSTSNYFMPLGSACAGRCGVALEKNEDDWQPSPIPQELIRLPD